MSWTAERSLRTDKQNRPVAGRFANFPSDELTPTVPHPRTPPPRAPRAHRCRESMAALRGGAIVSINHSQSASASIPTGARVNLPRLHVLNKEPTRGRDAASSSPASLAGGTAKSSPAESSAYVPPHFVVLMEPPYVSTVRPFPRVPAIPRKYRGREFSSCSFPGRR